MRRFSCHVIEPLESRIAPAGVYSFTDADGDTVKVATSKGNSSDLQALVQDHSVFNGTGYQVQEIDLTDVVPAMTGEFNGTSLTITVTHKAAAGDGLANIGWINAPGRDLGAVSIQGDLGRIDAGSDSAKVPAIASLKLGTFGGEGVVTQAGGGTLESDIKGRLGSLTVAGDMIGAYVNDMGTHGYIGSISLYALVGQNATDSGEITAAQGIGAVKILHNLAGAGTAGQQRSGYLGSGGKIASVQIGGSLVGDAAKYSGAIYAEEGIGPVTVTGDVLGGAGDYSGAIFTSSGPGTPIGQIKIGGSLKSAGLTAPVHTAYISTGTLAGITIGGDFEGGGGTLDGAIITAGNMGPVKILGGDMIDNGGSQSGYINSGGKLASLYLKGSLVGGSSSSEASGAEVFSTGDMGPVTITGNIDGGAGALDGIIDSHGKLASVSIGDTIVGGTGSDSGEIYSVLGLGPVKIGGSVDASGVNGSGQYNGYIGTVGNLASVKIGQSMVSGAASDSGEIYAGGNIGAINIAGYFDGCDYTGNTSIADSAAIRAGGRIGSIFVGKSIVGGFSQIAGKTTDCNVIHAGQDIGSITVKGDFQGALPATTPYDFSVTAVGKAIHSHSSDLAIGSIKVGGSVSEVDFLAGYGSNPPSTSDGSAQIGSVTVGHNWTASNLVAGVYTPGFKFGTAGDAFFTANPVPLPKIGSVSIGGTIAGLGNAGDHYGFVAGVIGSFKNGATVIHLHAGAGNDSIALDTGGTNDISIHEVNA